MYARPGIHVQSEDLQPEELQELYSKLNRYCHFLSQNKWDGEDLAQETLFKALHHYGKRKIELNAALLKKIAHNLWMDQLRKRNREVIGFTPEDTDEENKFKEETTDLIEHLISKLTSKQAVIFALKDAFRYQITEIAEIFGMTETAVKAVLSRARKRLAKLSSEEDLNSIQEFGDEDEAEMLRTTLSEAVRSEDPTVLIRIIPVLFPAQTQPKLKLMNFASPSSSLSMAA
ncbi:sigma-70 family RNA polymerase sigma factor [Alkalihalobacillus sp. TS-13]|uniref:sigma-70 family RNA polymerase sigma factor n=1 Tax=Alkalihalobacillus sp. TS-13 TaxID=2842455 RepID=UPI001C876260|nr:sigma-70 family RNA polymerase sigma factor [Alkalihalobacillus sp. TS-13]